MKHVFIARVEKGATKIVRKSDFAEVLNSFEGKEIQITIEKKKKSRSLAQNNYWWGVVIPMIKQGLYDQGMKLSKEETHEMLKMKFLKREIVNEATGEIYPYTGSSAELTTSGFMDLIAEVAQFAAEYLQVIIPEPGEQVKVEFE